MAGRLQHVPSAARLIVSGCPPVRAERPALWGADGEPAGVWAEVMSSLAESQLTIEEVLVTKLP